MARIRSSPVSTYYDSRLFRPRISPSEAQANEIRDREPTPPGRSLGNSS
jgi:hypothetical protein